MKTISDFIVRKRALVLAATTVLVVVCALFIPRVETNADMTKYLPDSSPMKQGMALMEEEFPDSATTQTIRVMFDGLTPAQNEEVKGKLEAIPHVDSVDYRPDSPDHNKDGHSLFVLGTPCEYDTPEELSIEEALDTGFSSYDMQWMTDNPEFEELPAWAIPLALAILLVVLLAMSSSWIEPFLFLASTGFAVIANMGTNIVLGSVSNITASIAAILQLILSMDYAIILMNRYRQEREHTPDKAEAMKRAWTNAFSSIASSSTTTVLGLLAMVFMSLKIGADLGFVLAKGVLLSMLCTLTILPGLILIFDKPIAKTAKKTPRLRMDRIGAFSYRARKATVVLFALLFAGTSLLQSQMGIVTSIAKEDPIADVFAPANPVVLLYDNDDEASIAELSSLLEDDPDVASVASYATTLGKPLTAAEMTDAVKDLADQGSSSLGLDASRDIDPLLIDLLYYDRLAQGTLHPIPVGEFLGFLSADVACNETLSGHLDEETRAKLEQLAKFSDPGTLAQPMDAEGLAQFLGMGAYDVEKLMVLYYAQVGGVDPGVMTLPTFASFVAGEVATDEAYASLIDQNAAAQLGALATFTDVGAMTAPRSAAEIAGLAGMDVQAVKLLFTYYYAQSPSYEPDGATLPAFAQFLANDVAAQPAFAGYLDEATRARLGMLTLFANPELSQKQMGSAELAGVLGMDEAMVVRIVDLYHSKHGIGGSTLSLEQLVGFLLAGDAENGGIASALDEATLQQLETARTIMAASSSGGGVRLRRAGRLPGQDEASAKLLCTYRTALHGDASSWKLSMQAFVNFLMADSGRLRGALDARSLQQLSLAQALINGWVAGTAYTPAQLSGLLGIGESQLNALYLLYLSEHGDTSAWRLSVQEALRFLASAATSDPAIASRAGLGAGDSQAASTLVDAVVSEKPHTVEELSLVLANAGQPWTTARWSCCTCTTPANITAIRAGRSPWTSCSAISPEAWRATRASKPSSTTGSAPTSRPCSATSMKPWRS
ncbi:MAG: MMPL family transporter [Gordonibacter pamelaeae]